MRAKLFVLNLIFILVLNLFLSMPACAIKIGLLNDVQENYVAVSSPGMIIDGFTNSRIVDLQQMQKYYLKKTGDGMQLHINNRQFNLNTKYVIIKSGQDGFVSTKNRWYRGDLIVINTGHGLTFINNVPLEYYLMGVVPSEMPSKWNMEAHKAQAIAARSYAIANLGKRSSHGYDLKDTPEDQAYGGATSETQRTNYAVATTRGQVLVYNEKIIPAYYHASSGGFTVNSGSVWNKNLPFVRSVPSFDGNLPKNGHGVGMSQNGANVLANAGYNAYQILGYFYKDVALRTVNSN